MKWQRYGRQVCFLEAPEICVEVVSPTNTRGELEEKKRLYSEEGAEEVWFCDSDGIIRFFHGSDESARDPSANVPGFPGRIE